MDKDPSQSEMSISVERLHAIGEALIALTTVRELDIKIDSEPQNLGMYDPGDKIKACKDPRTLKAEVSGEQIPVFCPIKYHVDANQNFYKGETTYFFNWQDYQPDFEQQIGDSLSQIPTDALIALERKAEDVGADATLAKLIGKTGRQIEILPKCLDEETGVIQNVTFYYSEIHRTVEKVPAYPNISTAYKALKDTDEWKAFEGKGVKFVSGENIAPHIKEGKTTKLLEDLWVVYDETFNKLDQGHPSDQKIPREFFDLLTTSPNSKVMYAKDEGEIVSALFIVEDLADLPWLNTAYYDKLNPKGKTVYMPGIATKFAHKKATSYSPRLIEAFSYIGLHIPVITALATQCTSVSARYIPRMTNRYTRGTINADMQEIAKYEYPVYRVL